MPADNAEYKIDTRSMFTGNVVSKTAVKDNVVIDKMWVKSRFMVPDYELEQDIVDIRYLTPASLKFTDTTMGGNVFVNARPQFNPLTDPKADTFTMNYATPNLDPSTGTAAYSTGMGEGYSELIDDNQQVVFLEFGLPKFNSLIDFFFRAVDYQDSVLANTGRPSTFYNAGQVIGGVGAFIVFPILTVTVYALKFALSALIGSGSLKFYYFDAKMHMYWGTVNTLVTQLVTEQGLLAPHLLRDDVKATNDVSQIGMPAKLNQGDIDVINTMLPGVISEDTNYIDIFSIVTKAQRKAIAQKSAIYKKLSEGKLEDARVISQYKELTFGDHLNDTLTFGNYLGKLNTIDKETRAKAGDEPRPKPPKVDNAAPKPGVKSIPGNESFNKKNGAYSIDTPPEEELDWFSRSVQVFDSSLKQGAAFAVFAVEYTGQTSESFSNSVTSINIGDQAKQLSNKSRALSYDLARGNVFGDSIMQDGVNAVKDIAMGVLSGATFNLSNVIASLTGNAYVEIPKRWDDSSMSFQQQTYKMSLIAPYNTFLSQLQNIYTPICMLLAGVLPLATGKSSYTSPFLCTMFSKGIENIQLGMITSVSITRGTSNLAFDKKRNPLAIDVTFTVTDFSTLVTSPVNSSIFGEKYTATMEDDTPLGNYISVLGGRDIMTAKYLARKIPKRLSKRLMAFEQTFNPDRISMLLGNALEGSLGALVSARNISEIFKDG